MPEVDLLDLGKALAVLRTAKGLDQAGLARASGLPASSISDYERGRTRPLERSLERMISGLGLDPGALEAALRFVRSVRGPERGGSTAAVRLGDAVSDLAGAIPGLGARPAPASESPDDRLRASALWQRLQPYGPAARRAIVRESPEFRSWALCELLREESVKAAAEPARASELAELALWIAGLAGTTRPKLVPGS